MKLSERMKLMRESEKYHYESEEEEYYNHQAEELDGGLLSLSSLDQEVDMLVSEGALLNN